MAAPSFAVTAALAAAEPCPICFGDMKTSVKNECGHSVCFSCQIECHRRGQSNCPQCRAPCEVPDNLNAAVDNGRPYTGDSDGDSDHGDPEGDAEWHAHYQARINELERRVLQAQARQAQARQAAVAAPVAAPAPVPAPAPVAAPVRHCSMCNSVSHDKRYHKQSARETTEAWHYRLYNYCSAGNGTNRVATGFNFLGQRQTIGWGPQGVQQVIALA
jgi:hypothetical protein